MKLLPSLCGLCLAGCLAMLPLVPRGSAPTGPTLRDEIAATRAEVARVRAQLRRQQAKADALSLKLRPSPSHTRTGPLHPR